MNVLWTVSPQAPDHKIAIPYAHILKGSEVMYTLHGFTRAHAIGRAVRKLQDLSKYGNEPVVVTGW